MKIKQITESSAGATASGSIAPVAIPMGKMESRTEKPPKAPKVQTMRNKGKKFVNQISESEQTTVSEAELAEQDLIIVPGMRKSKDTSFIPHKADRRDHEVEMARSDLLAAAKNAMRMYQLLKDRTEDQGLMGWQQSYITLATDYLQSVADNLEYDARTDEMTGGVLAGGMSNFEEGVAEGKAEVRADLDQAIKDFLAKGGEITKGKPGGPTTRKQQIRSLVKNLGSSHIGKRGESPRGDKVGKGANLKGSTVAKLSGGMSKVAEEKCPHCGGEMVSEELMNEKKDACYYKVKSRYKVWPSAYASGALVKCRKKGSKNWGKSKK